MKKKEFGFPLFPELNEDESFLVHKLKKINRKRIKGKIPRRPKLQKKLKKI